MKAINLEYMGGFQGVQETPIKFRLHLQQDHNAPFSVAG